MRVTAILLALLLAPMVVKAADARPKPPVWKSLAPFKDMDEFNEYRRRAQEAARANRQHWGTLRRDSAVPLLAQVPEDVPCDPAIEECGDSNQLDAVVVTGMRASANSSQASAVSITNNQEAGVDEGDIVKAWDRFLVVLMHGRLFSVDTAHSAGAMRLVDRIDAYRDRKEESWIDEVLISGDKLIVTGYSYESSSSSYSVFQIDRDGRLSFVARYFVESEDYYSAENYASRIVDGKLVVYAPFDLSEYSSNKNVPLPRIRRWTEAQGYGEWQTMFEISDVYRPIQPTYWPALHVLTFCDLESRAAKPCEARGVVGPWQRETYVTPDNYYLWLTNSPHQIDETTDREDCDPGVDTFRRRGHPSAVYRLSLSRHSLTAVHTEGWPRDQFGLQERDGDLWALLQRPTVVCRPDEDSESGFPMALAKVEKENFSARPESLDIMSYHRVPRVENPWGQQTRFSRNHVLYGSSEYYWNQKADVARSLTVVPLNSPRHARQFPLPHDVTRIELFGAHAVAFGDMPGNDLAVSSVSLGRKVAIVDTQVIPGATESEGRSHAFNARVESDGSGMFGLPTEDRSDRYRRYWHESSVDVQFFTAGADLKLDSARKLSGTPGSQRDSTTYQCEVSCYDWYGNARPIFFRGRIFALVGLELIEGELVNGFVTESARVNLAGTPVF
jgi:hypothetical protein